MSYLGFKTPVIKWFVSYQPNRKLFDSAEDVFSEARILNFGVPQRSFLGTILFLIYINGLCPSLSDCHLYVYDTSIFYQHIYVHEI